MKTNRNIKQLAVNSINEQANAISKLVNYIDESFIKAVNVIADCSGKLIVTGVGKSANIAKKLVATLNSTGTVSSFMHSNDAVHGDLGVIQNRDIVLFISNSGSTQEVKALVPVIKSLGNTIIAFSGNKKSYLALQSDVFINTSVEKETCPNNLAPTTSTAAQLVMGDALAICLLNLKGFTQQDFAKNHPGGILGKKLYLSVADVCSDLKPRVAKNDLIIDAIIEISSNRLGATTVLQGEKIIGIITDGDLRRMMETNKSFQKLKASDIMTHNPKTINYNQLASEALIIMKKHAITQLIVLKSNQYYGIIHIHDLLKEGI